MRRTVPSIATTTAPAVAAEVTVTLAAGTLVGEEYQGLCHPHRHHQPLRSRPFQFPRRQRLVLPNRFQSRFPTFRQHKPWPRQHRSPDRFSCISSLFPMGRRLRLPAATLCRDRVAMLMCRLLPGLGMLSRSKAGTLHPLWLTPFPRPALKVRSRNLLP